MSLTLILAFITWLQEKIDAALGLIQGALILAAVIVVATVAWRTRQLVPIIVAAVLSGLALFILFRLMKLPGV